MIPAIRPTGSSCLSRGGTSLLRLLSLGFVTLLTTGCATPVYENYLPWADGWRIGKVSRIEATADDFAFYQCRCGANFFDGKQTRFAIVQWRDVSRSRWTIARIPQGMSLVAGEEVYVKVWDCSAPLVKHDKN